VGKVFQRLARWFSGSTDDMTNETVFGCFVVIAAAAPHGLQNGPDNCGSQKNFCHVIFK
jgi:hypothetical protein